MTAEPVPQTHEPDEFGYTVADLHDLPALSERRGRLLRRAGG